ncbi:oligopeptide/dipeptide ABC transporter ATP-binding protein [Pseudothermotoga sp.]|nr:ATP-binding cassette domain-containing protein [Pseudothermotoga sp.]MCX7813380.1 ATP-binding cassette domain-containing protein [Pseudothermotoga sp.]MDW8139632.1 ATP-binding cassette domain-containing protein [Pseudothermotoga sp.]
MVEVRNLKKHFVLRGRGLWGKKILVKAVDDVSFSVSEGQSVAIVGESGSGKSTLIRCINGLIRPTSGEVYLDGQRVARLKGKEYREKVARKVQMVFQDPTTSLNPRLKVFDIVVEPVLAQGKMSKSQLKDLVYDLLEKVGLDPELSSRYPGELSGGQCQRVAIARALSVNPKILLLDEPTSSLDVSVQAQVLQLLNELRYKFNLTYIFVSHDLGVVRNVSETILVMYLGKIVEVGPVERVIDEPIHPYTKLLIDSMFVPDPNLEMRKPSTFGEPSTAVNEGCKFRSRCPFSIKECGFYDMNLIKVSENRFVSCIKWKEVS